MAVVEVFNLKHDSTVVLVTAAAQKDVLVPDPVDGCHINWTTKPFGQAIAKVVERGRVAMEGNHAVTMEIVRPGHRRVPLPTRHPGRALPFHRVNQNSDFLGDRSRPDYRLVKPDGANHDRERGQGNREVDPPPDAIDH